MGNRRGFTLIELMLAIAFISMLLLAIAAVGIQVGRIYTRGIVLRDVNQAGREYLTLCVGIFCRQISVK